MTTTNGILYRAGYKYQLAEDYTIQTDLRVIVDVNIPRACVLRTDGTLTIREGYCWDGPSGPAIDTKTFMRGSLVHDCIYQLIRLGRLPRSAKDVADDLLLRICREDGMNPIRARWVYWAKRFMSPATRPSAERPLLRAP